MQKALVTISSHEGSFKVSMPDNSIESKTSESGETSSSTFAETIGLKSNAVSNEQNTKPFHPDEHFPFLNSRIGSQNRSCQYQWFRQYPWLDYDIRNDSVSCFYCINQNNQSNIQAEHCKEEVFFKSGFKNWKKALVKFKEHQECKCHIASVTNEVIVSQCANVAETMNEKERDNTELNRRCLMTILESLQHLAWQGLALRGNDDETSSFYQLLKL